MTGCLSATQVSAGCVATSTSSARVDEASLLNDTSKNWVSPMLIVATGSEGTTSLARRMTTLNSKVTTAFPPEDRVTTTLAAVSEYLIVHIHR